MEWDDPDASHQDSHQGRHEEGRYRRIEVITAWRWGINRGLLSVWRRHVGLVQAKAAAETTAGSTKPVRTRRLSPISELDPTGRPGRLLLPCVTMLELPLLAPRS